MFEICGSKLLLPTDQSGPEIPPSLRILQKCTIINMLIMRGSAIQCHTYARNKALSPTSDPPSSANRMSLCAVMPSCSPKGPSCPSSGVERAIFGPTVHAQNPRSEDD